MRTEVITRLVGAQSTQKQRIRAQVAQRVTHLVGNFLGWYDHAAISALTEQIVELVEAGQTQTARITDNYLSFVAREMVGLPIDQTGLVDVTALRYGVDHQGVYGRLADYYRYKQSEGHANALALVLQRAQAMVATDLQLANTHQARNWMQARGWDRWRRVIRPERSKTGVCGLCLVAADRMYTRSDLMPIHDGCNCDVILVASGADPGAQMNAEDLDRIYAVAGTTYAEDLIKTRWRVDEHGEIGPVLVHEHHNHRGPDDLTTAA